MSQGKLRAGAQCFNRGEFFEAHELWEDAWREATEQRLFLQGVVQVAVALHHHSTGNVTGGTSVMARALRNLRTAPPPDLPFDAGEFLAGIERWCEATQRRERTALPQMTLREETESNR